MAGNDINLGPSSPTLLPEAREGSSINITGSNLVAENELNLDAQDVNIEAGEYTNTSNTVGGGLSFGYSGGTSLGVNATAYQSEGSQTVLTQSNLLATKININATQNTNIQASNLLGTEAISLDTNNLRISGNEAPFSSTTQSVGVGVNADVIQGGFTINGSYSESETSGRQYVSASISTPNLDINANNQNIEGANINGQEINPQESFTSSTTTTGGSIGFNPFTGTVSFSGNYNDLSVFGGVGPNAGYFGGGYENWILGTNLGFSEQASQGIFAGHSGIGTLGFNHSTTEGTSTHDVWSPNFNIFGVSGGAAFQEGEYIGSSINFGSHNLFTDINQAFQYTCFVAGTPINLADGRTKNIEDIKIGDFVQSWNEETGQIESNRVTKTFIRESQKILKLSFSNKKVLETTPDHPFWVPNKGWVEAGELNINDKFLDNKLNEISLLDIEEKSGTEVYNFTVENTHTYFADGVLVHNNTENYNGSEIVVLSGHVEQAVSLVSSGINNSDLFDRTFNDLERIIGNTVNLNPSQQARFINEIQEFRAQPINNNSLNELLALRDRLNQELMVNAIASGNYRDYGSPEQKQQIAKHAVELLKEDLLNAPQEEQAAILAELNYWEEAYAVLQNQNVMDLQSERAQQQLIVANLLLFAFDAEITAGFELAIKPLTNILKPIGARFLNYFEETLGIRNVIDDIVRNADNATSKPSNIFDYSARVEDDLQRNFLPGAELREGILQEDLFLVNYHQDIPLGDGRSVKWWTPLGQAKQFETIEDVHQRLALPYDWSGGDLRNMVSVAKIPKGTDIKAWFGYARDQRSRTSQTIFEGGGEQFRFEFFDEAWIVDTRSLNL